MQLQSEKIPTRARAASSDSDPEGIRRKVQVGLGIVAALTVGVCAIAFGAPISGAVLAGGNVVVDSSVKKVQHQTGGRVGEIKVKDGDFVRAGDILIKLDDTLTKANLQIVVKQLNELWIRMARLKAERDDASDFEVPDTLSGQSGEPAIAELISSEMKLFKARQASRAGQKDQLRERITQLHEESRGLTSQLEAKRRELELVREELAGQEKLWQKNLLPVTKYVATQREATRLKGEHGQLIAQSAQVRGKIAETELQIRQIDQDRTSESMRDLRDAQGKEAELLERRVAALDHLRQIDIRSPQNGFVHQLAVHTVGGVVGPGEQIMLIVPSNDVLVVEAKVAPHTIDHVKPGSTAFVRFSAFNQSTTPEFEGVVSRVSADLTREAGNSAYGAQPFFTARIAFTNTEAKKVAELNLIPGMPADVHIRTGDRTLLSYLVKPLRDQFALTFRER
jgi:HlyD family secretion protein